MATKEYSSVQEHKVADALGWEVVTGSGARPTVPGDVKSDKWLGECKTHTEKGQKIFFDLAVWQKISKEADATHRSPALIVDDGSQDLKHTWVACRQVSVDTTTMAMSDPYFAVRKNISFEDVRTKEYLESLYKLGGGIVFDSISLELTWNNEQILVMTFDTFTKVFDR